MAAPGPATSHAHKHTLGTEALALVLDCSLSRLVRGSRTCGLVVKDDGSALARRGGLHRQRPHAAPLSPGRRWSCMARLLLKMSGPIPRPRGCSETGHINYEPLTRWHRWRLPSSLPHIVFQHLRWKSLRTVTAGPMFRWGAPSFPSENARVYDPVQFDAAQCGVVVSRNTRTHTR